VPQGEYSDIRADSSAFNALLKCRYVDQNYLKISKIDTFLRDKNYYGSEANRITINILKKTQFDN